MGSDFATVALTRSAWASIFLGQLNYLYSLVQERNECEEGSDQWNCYQRSLRDSINTFMPVLQKACMDDPEIDKQWFEFKVMAGMFPMDSLVDNAKNLVHVVSST